MTEPSDQAARDRFVANARPQFLRGRGGRFRQDARGDRSDRANRAGARCGRMLPRLVVLTFANRAADEMQQRAREQILLGKPRPEILAAFNRTWFGTIHAFCLKLLNDYGHYLGLPAPLELITDDDDLWNEFVQQQTHVGRSLSAENRATLLRLASMRHIMELGRQAGSALLHPGEPCPCPEIKSEGRLPRGPRGEEKRYDWEFHRPAPGLERGLSGRNRFSPMAHLQHDRARHR